MTAKDRQRKRAYVAHYAELEADLRSRFRNGDEGAEVLAEHYRHLRLSIEGELAADEYRAALSCAGETLDLFERI